MPFDLVAWYESQACAALTACAAVTDDVYRVSGDDIYVKARAPLLAGLSYGAISQATVKYSELRQPSLKTPYRSYVAADLNDPLMHESFLNLFGSPLPLYADEKLNAYVQNATNEIQQVIAWLSSGAASLSDLENVSPTHLITGYADAALTAGAWHDVTITWDQDLPLGRYAVVGMINASYKAAAPAFGAARLNLLDTKWVPGTLTRNAEADKLGVHSLAAFNPNIGERWPLMTEISFRHDQMPNVQILAGAANTDHVINLLLQKIS